MRTYEFATQDDDAVLRSLLRENAMPSWVTMSMEREPSYFAGDGHFGRDWAIIARDGTTPIGMGSCSEQSVHLNGAPVELGYLGMLRVDSGYRHRVRILREAYAALRQYTDHTSDAVWYTSIAAENFAARRILEANLPGMPFYRHVNDLVTLALPRARGTRLSRWRAMNREEAGQVCAFYNRQARQYQFSPALTPEIIDRTGASFYVVERQGDLAACMALWHQLPYKQVVARGYRQPLAAFLPVYNTVARIAKRVQLPGVGHALDQTNLAFLAVAPVLAAEIVLLLKDALALCPTTVMTLGLHAEHPWLAPLARAFSPMTYRTGIYTVSFGNCAELDGHPAQPEVAVL